MWRDRVYHFDAAAADRAADFFPEMLRHVKGEWSGRPLVLQPWERDIIRAIFGWKREDGLRRIRRVYIEIGKKNGKSTLAAGIGALLTFADNEPGAEVYSAAADREQAAIVFELAHQMVERSPVLARRAMTYRRAIVVPATASSWKVLSSDAPTKHGFNCHGIIFDELHTQPNRDLWDTLTAGVGARRQPLVVALTTAGYDRNSICWEIHDYAVRVRDGLYQDDEFLPVIFAVDEKADWRRVRNWKKANPSLGVTPKLEFLKAECKRAQETPGYENTFRRLYLNQWTEQAHRWLDMARWRAFAGTVDASALVGKPCYGGLDLSTTRDLTAFAALFPEQTTVGEGEDEQTQIIYRLLMKFWLPEAGLRDRCDRDRVPYDLWAKQGLITLTPGDVVDYARVRIDINEFGASHPVQEVGYDRWNASQLVTELQHDGFTMVPIAQGMASMSAPSREFETLLICKRLHHGGNPVLEWMASNVAADQDANGNIMPRKGKSAQRIDGIVAAIMALARAMVQGRVIKSVYETEEVTLV